MSWRRGRDSNPRYPCEYAAFRVRCFQPLSHLSGAVSPTPSPLKTQVIHADLVVPISSSKRFAPALLGIPLARAFANQHSPACALLFYHLAVTIYLATVVLPVAYVRPGAFGRG
jgi:hypothetical protein